MECRLPIASPIPVIHAEIATKINNLAHPKRLERSIQRIAVEAGLELSKQLTRYGWDVRHTGHRQEDTFRTGMESLAAWPDFQEAVLLQAKYASQPVNAIATALPGTMANPLNPTGLLVLTRQAAANTVLVYPALSGDNFRGPFCNQMVYFHA